LNSFGANPKEQGKAGLDVAIGAVAVWGGPVGLANFQVLFVTLVYQKVKLK
jgi:hypothetical protein